MSAKLKLLTADPSPYGRKVKMTLKIKGLYDQTELVQVNSNAGDAVLDKANPLAKVPALITADGLTVYDSKVICEYLDSIGTGPVLFPKEGRARWETLTMGALGDGILDAALLLVYEGRFRPENMRVDAWCDRQWKKINQALAYLEANPPVWAAHPHYGHLVVAAGLGYLDLRHGGRWRETHPKLVKWLDQFAAAVPAFEATKPVV
jgi:glutathione S-transferase